MQQNSCVQGGGITDAQKQACCNNGGACSQLDLRPIGFDSTWDNNLYSFCVDSLKQCMLGEYVCNSEELMFEFFNAWITGTLYFTQIRYKERVNSNGYLKKAKFCDADWEHTIGTGGVYLYPNTIPFTNDIYDTVIVEREPFQFPGYYQLRPNAGLVKYWPRQDIPPLGWIGWNNNHSDYIKGPFDDIYYNARVVNRSEGWNDEDNLNTDDQHILLATEIMSLGSYLVVDDPDNAPFFIGQIPPTTYKRPENLTDYFCFTCNEIVPNGGIEGANAYEKICEFGTDFNDEDEVLLNHEPYGVYVDVSYLSGRTYILYANTVQNEAYVPIAPNPINPPQKEFKWEIVSLRYGHDALIGGPYGNVINVGQEWVSGDLPTQNAVADDVYLNSRFGFAYGQIYTTRFFHTAVNNTILPTQLTPTVDNRDLFVRYEANPYYMYYGLHPGKTAIDLVHDNFIPKNICNV